mgnify:CR=1 FL=1
MAKHKKQLTAQEVQTGFEALNLNEQIQVFKANKIVLEEKKKEAAQNLNSLQAAEIE